MVDVCFVLKLNVVVGKSDGFVRWGNVKIGGVEANRTVSC